jgi:hypothetical protein
MISNEKQSESGVVTPVKQSYTKPQLTVYGDLRHETQGIGGSDVFRPSPDGDDMKG